MLNKIRDEYFKLKNYEFNLNLKWLISFLSILFIITLCNIYYIDISREHNFKNLLKTHHSFTRHKRSLEVGATSKHEEFENLEDNHIKPFGEEDIQNLQYKDNSNVYFVNNENKHDFKHGIDLVKQKESYQQPLIAKPLPTVGGNENLDRDDYFDNDQEKNKKKKKMKEADFSEEKRLHYHSAVADQIFANNIRANLEILAAKPHLAGTKENNELAKFIKKRFVEYGMENVVEKKYNVLLSYPRGTGNLTLFDKYNMETEVINVVEKPIDDFEKSTDFYPLPPFLAYTKSGEVEGEMVYANFGSDVDFEDLQQMGVTVKDKIVLIRYGLIPRNKKIRYAEQFKAKGVILFSDPDTYSPTGVFYPNSWYLSPDGVQRGTLLRMRGDPLSRGYPALEGLYQRPLEEVSYFPDIPVQPLGFGDAEKLLKTLDGLSPVSKSWNGALNLTSYNITSKDGRKVRLSVNVSREMRDIVNVIAVIRGEIEPDRLVIVGNHRDAWTYGAADPSSATAVMLEVARALGWLMKEKGWRPRRTIMFCSFDAEEYGLLGSTEWTEEFAKILQHQAVAYINVDTAVQGNDTMLLKSTPELVDTFFDAAKRFKNPDGEENLYDAWVRKHNKDKNDNRREPKIKLFRESSDYMPFYGNLGIPSLDFRYTFNTKDQGVYNFPVYHTMHDNINFLKKFIDPDFRYHATVGKVWTQLILLLADTLILPFNFERYSDSLSYRVKKMIDLAKDAGVDKSVDMSTLGRTVTKLKKATEQFHSRLKDLDKSDVLAVRMVNDQMMMFERTFVTSEDIPGEPKTRHVYHTAGMKRALRALIRADKNLKEAGKVANKNASEDGMFLQDDNTTDGKEMKSYKKAKKQYNKILREFKIKFSIYTYHVMMAVHALKNPFTSDVNTEDYTDDGLVQQEDLAPT